MSQDAARAARAEMPTMPETTAKPLDDWRDEAIAQRVAVLIGRSIEERDRRYAAMFAEMLADEREKFERHVTKESDATRANSNGLAARLTRAVNNALADHEKIRRIEVDVAKLREDVASMREHGVRRLNGGAGGG